MIIIITALSFIPAMNIYESALLDGPNWKSIYVARTEDTRKREREWINLGEGAKLEKMMVAWVPYFCSVFIIFQVTVKAHLGRAIKANY